MLLAAGAGLALILLNQVYLPRLGVSLEEQQRQQQRRQELIVGMSHDLKSPMTSIRAYTEALLDGVPPEQLPRLFDPFYRGDAAHPKLLQTVWGVGYRLGRTAR